MISRIAARIAGAIDKESVKKLTEELVTTGDMLDSLVKDHLSNGEKTKKDVATKDVDQGHGFVRITKVHSGKKTDTSKYADGLNEVKAALKSSGFKETEEGLYTGQQHLPMLYFSKDASADGIHLLVGVAPKPSGFVENTVCATVWLVSKKLTKQRHEENMRSDKRNKSEE